MLSYEHFLMKLGEIVTWISTRDQCFLYSFFFLLFYYVVGFLLFSFWIVVSSIPPTCCRYRNEYFNGRDMYNCMKLLHWSTSAGLYSPLYEWIVTENCCNNSYVSEESFLVSNPTWCLAFFLAGTVALRIYSFLNLIYHPISSTQSVWYQPHVYWVMGIILPCLKLYVVY